MYRTSDDSDQLERLDQETLMTQLNALLASLHLPIPLMSPTDLTPRLLVAILESLTGMRLPITYNHELKDSKRAHAEKVQAMKIFLGVLETDFLQMDVGISDLDPRRLADGEWEEVLYIAELLCWIGRRAGLVSASDDDVDVKTPSTPPKQRLSPKSHLDLDAEPLYQSSSTGTGIERLSDRTFSPFLKEKGGDSMTSVDTVEDQDEVSLSDTISDVHSFHDPFTIPPRCIHEVPSSSLLFSVNLQLPPSDRTPSPDHNSDCHPSTANTLPIEHDHPNTQPYKPFRTTGFIQPVDEEAEIASFERSRSISPSSRHRRDHSEQSASQKEAKILAVHEQYMQFLAIWHTIGLNTRRRLSYTQGVEAQTALEVTLHWPPATCTRLIALNICALDVKPTIRSSLRSYEEYYQRDRMTLPRSNSTHHRADAIHYYHQLGVAKLLLNNE